MLATLLETAAHDVAPRMRAANRERIRHMAKSYRRERHLLAAAPGFGRRGDNHPLDRVNPCWLDTDAHTAKTIARAILRRLLALLAERSSCHVEAKLDLLRVALRGEIANHVAAVARGEMFAE